MRARPIAFGILMLALTAAMGLLRVPSSAAPTVDADDPPRNTSPVTAPRFIGSLSCSASACHGSVATPQVAGSIGRNEYIFWLEHDPHARSAESLSAPQGLAILHQLQILKDGRIIDEAGYRNCRACHALAPPPDQRLDSFAVETEGVGCESCHGAAEHWRNQHYRRDFQREQMQPLGMRDTKDLQVRAAMCVNCHVGTPQQQVNHDLIAAGHPVLKFELSAYHAMLPKHWRADEEQRQRPTMELDLWIAGRHSCQIAAAELLRGRAANGDMPWPELADYDCFACHHDLEFPSRRQTRGFGSRRPGAFSVSAWYWPWTESHADASILESTTEWQALRQLLEKRFPPDRAQVAAQAEKVLAALRQSAISDASPNRMLGHLDTLLTGEQGPHIAANWDQAAQIYLCLVAVWQTQRNTHALTAETVETISQQLRELRGQLAFAPGVDSPQSFGQLTSSPDADPTSFIEQARRIIASLRTIGGAP